MIVFKLSKHLTVEAFDIKENAKEFLGSYPDAAIAFSCFPDCAGWFIPIREPVEGVQPEDIYL